MTTSPIPPTFRKPRRLRAGDTVAAISLSSGLAHQFPHRYEAGKRQLRDAFQINIIETPHALRSSDFLKRNPQARADDLHRALTHPDVNAIISTIGGDDSVRLLPCLDLALVRENPKVLLGFSDTTTVLTAFLEAGVHAFHGPSLMTDLAENGGLHPYVRRSLKDALFDGRPTAWTAATEWTEQFLDWADANNQATPRDFQPNPGWAWLQGSDVAEGHLVGGCIEILELLKGTPWWPQAQSWDGAVLMLETSEEAPPPRWVGRWLLNYANQDILQHLAALLFARPMHYTQEQTAELREQILNAVADAGRPDLPVITNLDTGHTSPQMTVPLGSRIRIDPIRRKIVTIEAAVT